MEIVKDTILEHDVLFWPVRPPRASMLVVMKATFALPASGVAELAHTQDPASGSLHWDEDPTQSPRTPNDFALLKPEGECFVIGSCRTLTGRPETRTIASFRIGPIGKTFVVHGDRRWARGEASAPMPFTDMALRCERAFGGPGFEANPRGRGLAPDANGDVWLPNVELDEQTVFNAGDRPRPAISGPIPMTYTERARFAGTYDAAWRANRFPWLPDDFRFAYWNEAPADQRIESAWRGDEPIALRHLHPVHPIVQTKLPGVRARAFMDREDGRFVEVALVLDTITVDADRGIALATWRGLVELDHDRLAPDGIARLFTMHEEGTTSTIAQCRDRMLAAIAAACAAEVELAGEAPPPFEAPVREASGEAVSAEFGPARLEKLKAELRAAGVDADRLLAEANVPLAPPDPEKLRAAFTAMGLEMPQELDDVLREVLVGPPAPTPLVAPVRAPTDLRALVLDAHRRGRPLKGDFTGANLAELDLRGLDARGAILVDANLRGANVSGGKFDGANLSRADFLLANVTNASFRGCDLTAAIFEDARMNGAHLEDATLESAELQRAALDGAHLRGADLTGAILDGASLIHANADRAIFDRAKMSGCRCSDSSFVDARMYGTVAREVNFDRADLSRARIGRGADFTGGTIRSANASGSFWRGAILDGVLFAKTVLRGADFTGAQMRGTQLAGCSMRGAVFQASVLTGATLREADVYEGSFREANLERADMRGANLYCADFFRAHGEDVALEGANVDGTYWERP